MDKFHQNLGLCMRAGKLISGDESVLKSIRTKQAHLIIVAKDASKSTLKKFLDKCQFYHIPIVQGSTRVALSDSIGKQNRVVVAVTDPGFSKLLQQELENQAEVERID